MNTKEVLSEIRNLLGFNSQEDNVSVEFATATLTDGTIIKWEGELAVGTAIFVETAEGDIPAPDETHEVEGGQLITTVNGLVTEIVEPQTTTEQQMNAFDSAIESVNAKMDEKIAELNAKIDALISEKAQVREAMSKVVSLVEALAESPSDKPTETPKVATKKEAQFDNLLKFAKSLNK
jgi:hypothetical protein